MVKLRNDKDRDGCTQMRYIPLDCDKIEVFPPIELAEKIRDAFQLTQQDIGEMRDVHSIKSTHPLLNRPPNPALDIIRKRH